MTADTRRVFLRNGALAALALATRREAGAAPPPRVGIVGGGLAGVSCAWLLDGAAESVLFESRNALGGHSHTVDVDVSGQEVSVDVGAQFFAPGPHPTYSKLVELLGLASETFESEMSITVTGAGEATPRFVSPANGRSWPPGTVAVSVLSSRSRSPRGGSPRTGAGSFRSIGGYRSFPFRKRIARVSSFLS